MRIGIGYDVHRLVPGRALVLGGVTIPFDKGLLGHSDADVLVHAACDALLGAAGLEDLGSHFPDHDATYKDVYSIELLRTSIRLIRSRGFDLVNLDAVIFAQAPKIAPYRDAMKQTMARAMACDETAVNIKATTTEGLGHIGKGEGMAAQCVVLIGKFPA
jgi:2-C-methyl-D-erythritol 2,4-cyclodiphosphate synthase